MRRERKDLPEIMFTVRLYGNGVIETSSEKPEKVPGLLRILADSIEASRTHLDPRANHPRAN